MYILSLRTGITLGAQTGGDIHIDFSELLCTIIKLLNEEHMTSGCHGDADGGLDVMMAISKVTINKQTFM
jgi:L-fucose isomerase-like protein